MVLPQHVVCKLESGSAVMVLAQDTGISLLSSNCKERPCVPSGEGYHPLDGLRGRGGVQPTREQETGQKEI